LPDATEDVLGMLAAYFPPAIARAVLRSTLRRGGLADDRLEAVDLASFASTLEQTLTMYIVDPVRRGECVAKVRRLLPLASMEPIPTPAPRSSPRQTPVRPSADPERRTPVPDGASSAPGGVVRVRQASDVVHACDLARATARGIGFTLLDQTKIATVASELARNILLYVGDGELRVAALESPRRGIQISAVDSGTGIADVDLVMSGGYRSRTGMGLGLKGTKRLMDALEIDSRPGRGTTVVARKLLS
jgi:serine/threonine-protein kinase RsbT